MAYIRTVEGHYIKITPEQGNKLWLLSNGELEPTPNEEEKLCKIDKIILNSKNPTTPLSYLTAHVQPVEIDYKVVMGMGKR